MTARAWVLALLMVVLPGCDWVTPAECETACDCEPGFDCLNGECLSGTVAVYCCDACPPEAPPTQACVHPDGRRTSCGGR